MRQFLYNFFILVIPYFSFSQDKFLEEASQKWASATEYTQKVMEAMPQKQYGFKPTKLEMSFEEQLVHMANNMNWLGKLLSEKPAQFPEKQEVKGKSRKEIIEILNISMANIQDIINKFNSNQLNDLVDFPAKKLSKRQVITLLNDHHTHHRAQLLVYLRLIGKTPPSYIGW